MACRIRLTARAAALLVALTLLAGGAIPVLAHTKQETTFPEDGAVLGMAPSVVSMTFGAPMRITSIQLTSEAGGTFELERSDAMAPVTEFHAPPPPLPKGRYTVEWRGLSSDGHPMKGSFSFEVAP